MQTSFSKEQFIYAGFFSRLAAFLIDSVFLALILLIVKVPVWVMKMSMPDAFLFQPFLFEFTVADVFFYLLTLAYYVLMTYYSGATVGKHLMKLKVVDENGQKLTFMSVLIRESVGKYLSAFLVNIGYIMVAFDSRKQGLHDKIADTCVVYRHGLNQPRVQKPIAPAQPVTPVQSGMSTQPVTPVQSGMPMPPVTPVQPGASMPPVTPAQQGQPTPFVQPPVQQTPVQQPPTPQPNGKFSLPE